MSIEQFGKNLVSSGLLTAEEVKALWNGLPAEGRPKDGDGFAQALVAAGKLTPFQAQELLAGRGARLLMGDYTIVAEIGAGGMGQVYKAQHRRMKRVVALKVMSSAAMKDAAAVKRFQREVEAAARLEHPNIVTAYDSGEAGSVKYLVMQFVDGGDLSDLVKKNGPLPIERAVDYVIQAARGLSFAHGAGVVHRDIKPANLLLDKKGVVKILDMGLARIEDGDGLTATEQVMGTVDYMSPEQAADTKNAEGRSDIYSLGCTLWYLLTAKKLYDGDTMISRLMKHRDAPLPSLVKERDDASWPLEQVFHKMIAKRPQDRYQSMDEVVAALEPHGGGNYGGSSGGMGSSIGGGKAQSAELASFMQAMASPSKPAQPAVADAPGSSSKTKLPPDVTAAFARPEAETDPKSEVLPQATYPGSHAKANAPARKKQPPVKLIAAGILGVALFVVAGIIIKVRDQDGNVVAELNVPSGASAEIAATPMASDDSPAAKTLSIADMLDSPDYVWSEPENLGPTINGPGNEDRPSLTNDQLRIRFSTYGDNGPREAVRTSTTVPFGTPSKSLNVKFPWLSGDGLTLAYVGKAPDGATDDLHLIRRATTESEWEDRTSPGPEFIQAGSAYRPTLSPDGLTLVFSLDRDLWMSRRASPDKSFGPATKIGAHVNNSEKDEKIGQLLADNQTFVFNRDNNEWYFTFTSQTGVKSALSFRDAPFVGTEVWFAGDGTSVYFAADLPGGFGERDIWVTRLVPKSGTSPSVTTTHTPVAPAPSSTPPTTSGSPQTHSVAELLESPDYAWSAPENLGSNVNTQHVESKPTLTADELRLMFRCDAGATSGTSSLWECKRATIDEPFGPRVRLTGSAYEDEPFLSADGLTLLYDTHAVPSGRLAEDIRRRRRPGLDAPWGKPESVLMPEDHDEQSPWLSPDELTLIYASPRAGGSGLRDLWICKRDTPDAPFGPSTNFRCGANSPASEGSPQLLSDGRTVLFSREGKPFVTFTSPTGVVSALSLRGVPDDVREPWLSADGRRLYFHSNRPGGQGGEDLWMMRLTPKAGAASLQPNSPNIVFLDDLPEVEAKVGYSVLGKHGKYDDLAEKGKPIIWRGASVPHALWMHPQAGGVSFVRYQIDGRFATLAADVGIHEGSTADARSPVVFRILGDGRELWKSAPMQKMGESAAVSVDINGVRELRFETSCGDKNGNCHATWFLPRLTPVMKPAAGGVVYLDEVVHKSYAGYGESPLKLAIDPDAAATIAKLFPGESSAPTHAIVMHSENEGNAEKKGTTPLLATLDYDLTLPCDRLLARVRGGTGGRNDTLFAEVWGDGKKLWESSDLIDFGPAGIAVDVDIRGVRELQLTARATKRAQGSHVLWLDPRVTSISNSQSPISNSQPAVVYLDDLPETAFASKDPLRKHGRNRDDNKDLNWLGQKPSHSLFTHPVGVHQPAWVTYTLDGRYAKFRTTVGASIVPDSPLTFRIFGDGTPLWESKPQAAAQVAVDAVVDVRGVKVLKLEVVARGSVSGAHALWIEPRLTPLARSASPTANTSTQIERLLSADYEWSAPESLGPTVNAAKEVGGPTLSDDQLCLITQQYGKPGEITNGLREYRRQTVDAPWGDVVQVVDTSEGYPSLSADGLTLLTVTDSVNRADGKTHRDLMLRTRTARGAPWGPRTLIASLNSDGNEYRPVIASDGLSLVFSSNRAGGVGGMDLWISRRDDVKADWRSPVLLGRKVNTSKEEYASQILSDGKTILVNRDGDLFLAAPDAQGNYDLRPVPLPTNLKTNKCWLSPDGAMLYLDNNRKIGEGDNEIRLMRRVPKEQSAAITSDSLDRKVARRLLELKFPLRLKWAGEVHPIKPGSPLPDEPFVVAGIDAGVGESVPRAELVTLLGDFRRLSSVDNTFLPVKDCDLWAETLASMPSLMAVNAARCEELTDVGAAHLARLPKLEYVNIGSSLKITGEGLTAFEVCKSLTTIELSPQAVTDGKYTLADIQKLQDALPKTRVVFGGVKPIPGLKPAGQGAGDASKSDGK